MRFTSVMHAFGGFANPEDASRFRRRMDLYRWRPSEHNMSGSWMGLWPGVVNEGEGGWPVLEHIPRSQRGAVQP